MFGSWLLSVILGAAKPGHRVEYLARYFEMEGILKISSPVFVFVLEQY